MNQIVQGGFKLSILGMVWVKWLVSEQHEVEKLNLELLWGINESNTETDSIYIGI